MRRGKSVKPMGMDLPNYIEYKKLAEKYHGEMDQQKKSIVKLRMNELEEIAKNKAMERRLNSIHS